MDCKVSSKQEMTAAEWDARFLSAKVSFCLEQSLHSLATTFNESQKEIKAFRPLFISIYNVYVYCIYIIIYVLLMTLISCSVRCLMASVRGLYLFCAPCKARSLMYAASMIYIYLYIHIEVSVQAGRVTKRYSWRKAEESNAVDQKNNSGSAARLAGRGLPLRNRYGLGRIQGHLQSTSVTFSHMD